MGKSIGLSKFEKKFMKFERIVQDKNIMMGKPVIKGTRITVEFIIEQLSNGASVEWILESYPHLKKEDVLEALRYAYALISNEEILEATV